MEFNDLPKHARVWIYQADRELSKTEQNYIRDVMNKFMREWAAHGSKLSASFKVEYNRFLIIAVDEEQAQASGCSIDASVAVVKEIEKEVGVDFFNRQIVAYLGQNDELKTTPLHDFWAMKKAGVIDDDTKVFNNLVRNVEELNDQWLLSFKNSWHSEMFR